MIREIVSILLNKKDTGTLKAHMVRGTVGTFALKVVNTVLAFGTSLLLARLLGAKEYGVYAYAISWASLLSVPAVMGLNTLLVREIARYRALKDWSFLKGILRWSDRVVLSTSIGLALVFALMVGFHQGKFMAEVRIAMWVATALIPLLSLLLLRQGALRGLGRVVEAQIPLTLVLPTTFLILTTVLYFLWRLNGAVAVGTRLLGGLVATSLSQSLLWKHLPVETKDVLPTYSQREWLKSALPLFFVGAAGIINQRIATVMVGTVLGSEAAGIFDVAMKAAAFVAFPIIAVNMPLAPAVVCLYAQGDKKRLQRLITVSVRVALLSSLPIVIGMIFFGRWVLLIFGREFTKANTALAILSVGQLVKVGMGSVGLLLNMTGNERDTAKGVGIAALVNVVLNAVLIPVCGVEGAAIANAISMVTWSTILAWWVYKRIGIYSAVLSPRRVT